MECLFAVVERGITETLALYLLEKFYKKYLLIFPRVFCLSTENNNLERKVRYSSISLTSCKRSGNPGYKEIIRDWPHFWRGVEGLLLQ